MTIRNCLITVGLTLTYAGVALGAVSADKASQLGKNLTLVGAEKAGNKDGSIPEYSGGLTTPPASYKKGSGIRPDPFEGEKPLYSINAKNMDKYAGELTEGAKALMKKYPTYRIDVYKTHRTAAFPKYVLDNTVKHATTAKTTNEGLSLTGAHAGYPFPIPQTGNEAMWNHQLRFNGLANEVNYRAFTVDRSGRATMQAEGNVSLEYAYYDPAKPDTKDYYGLRITYEGPPRRAGEALLIVDPIDFGKNARRAWQYLPGQRRVKLAPDLSFDTPNATVGGAATWDDLYLFSGSMERFNFKIIGKKELMIPYNDYKMAFFTKNEDLLKPHFLNPDVVRWEKHRVWVVEATLKPGKRHLYSKRVFYLDEDSWVAVASDAYDARGQLFRVSFAYITPAYEVPAPMNDIQGGYDLISEQYFLNAWPAENRGGFRYTQKRPASDWTPESIASGGVR